ncbi:MAG: hypothetical protein RLZZ58_517 [Pseudomonadota bacterium]
MRTPKLWTTLQDYQFPAFRRDVVAGITVALVALPLSIAIAIASGATPAQGILTAIVGGFVISLMSGSRVQIGGPTGAFIVVTYGIIAKHGYDGMVVATMMAGVILLIAGFLRLGRFVSLVPEAVINGFTIGIAVVIAATQLKDVFGLKTGILPAEFLPKMDALWDARASLQPESLVIALVALAVILAIRRWLPRVPGPIVAVFAATMLTLLFDWPVDSIASRFGHLPRGLPMLDAPELSFALAREMLPSALIIAFLAGVE